MNPLRNLNAIRDSKVLLNPRATLVNAIPKKVTARKFLRPKLSERNPQNVDPQIIPIKQLILIFICLKQVGSSPFTLFDKEKKD